MTLPFASLPFAPPFVFPPESSASSHVVALVEYEPCAEELRLCGGDGKLNCPSESTVPEPVPNTDAVLELR